MQGANVMCPGLTSEGGKIDENLPSNSIVISFFFYKFINIISLIFILNYNGRR